MKVTAGMMSSSLTRFGNNAARLPIEFGAISTSMNEKEGAATGNAYWQVGTLVESVAIRYRMIAIAGFGSNRKMLTELEVVDHSTSRCARYCIARRKKGETQSKCAENG